MSTHESEPKLRAIGIEIAVPLLRKMTPRLLQGIVDGVITEIELPSWIEPEGTFAVVHPDGPNATKVRFVLPTYLEIDEHTYQRVTAFQEILDLAMDEQRTLWEREHGVL